MSDSWSTARDYRAPVARARGLGSAKSGTGHFWYQRLTAMFLLVLTPWILGMLVALAGADIGHVFTTLGKPINAIPMALFLLSLFWHAKLGLQVVIEDYIHHRATEIFLQVFVAFACALGALASLYALARIALLN
ncbi:MAG: succinate dehydrogenase, hydrophobic membrane anchor protein [Lysobacter sp.]|nr:succinate dehydrogenase, hydrophobic membrane anchor protein [Lysobacter sp.]